MALLSPTAAPRADLMMLVLTVLTRSLFYMAGCKLSSKHFSYHQDLPPDNGGVVNETNEKKVEEFCEK